MSLEPIERKQSITEIKAGVHLLCIFDMNLLKYADGKVHKIDGFPAIIVTYKDGQNKTHEQMYLMDGDFRQKAFERMLQAAQVPTINGTSKKADAIGKRLWAAIREVHYVDDDVIIKNAHDGSDKVENYIFKVYPFIEGGKKPRILGDPEENDGIATQEFLSYKNVSGKEFVDEMQTYKKQDDTNLPKEITVIANENGMENMIKAVKDTEEEMPTFDDQPTFQTSTSQISNDDKAVNSSESHDDNEVPNF